MSCACRLAAILQDLLSLEAEAQQFLTDLQDALHGIGMLRAFRRAVDQAMRAELSRDTGARRLQASLPLDPSITAGFRPVC